jgi:hypothetical protein
MAMANNITDIERLNYYEGEFLGALDFQAEQEYHRDMRRRHNVGQHTWGIVSGLELVQIPNGNNVPGSNPQVPEVDVFIQPGMAVDAFGREIVVLNKTQLTQDLFASFSNLTGAQTMSIWISYGQLMLQPPQDACTQINQPNAFGRVQESFALTVTQNGTKPPNDLIVVDGMTLPAPPPPQPGDIVVPDDDSIPYQEFSSDDSTINWHILLGQVTWYPPTLGVFGKLDDSKARAGRLYCGSVASAVYAPAGALTLKDRFTTSPLPTGSNGVSVEVEGSLTVDRLLNAEQNLLVGSVFDPKSTLTISPVTINASQTDQSFIQLRDSSGVPKWSIWDKPKDATEAGLNIGGADSSSGKPAVTSALFIQKGGNVGIGTSNPTQNLSVNGGINVDSGAQNNGSSLNPGLSFGSNATEGIASNQAGGTRNASGLDLFTATVPRLSITRDGKVGIGTPSPRNPLGIRGASTWEELLSFEDASGNTKWHVNQNPQGPNLQRGLNFSETGISDFRLFLQAGGKVGIGTGTPMASLDVASGLLHVGGTTTPVVNKQQGAYLGWNALTGGTGETDFINNQGLGTGGFAFMNIAANSPNPPSTLMVITGGGNVGIGTAMPTAQLEATGSVKFQNKSLVQIYRLYNSSTGDHFYTPSAAERDNAVANDGYVDETAPGSSFYAFA